jgi:RimJ/RimL family protein N-acetyltransferase
MNILLQTERLRLRQLVEADAPRLLALDSDPEVMRYIGPVVTDLEVHRTFLRERAIPYYTANPGYGFFAAEQRETGTFLGWFIFRPALHFRYAAAVGFTEGDTEIGYRLHKSAWGRGYATEGARALRDMAFQERQVHHVVAVALKTNVASWRVMEKIGMVRAEENALPHYDVPAVTYRLRQDAYTALPDRL